MVPVSSYISKFFYQTDRDYCSFARQNKIIIIQASLESFQHDALNVYPVDWKYKKWNDKINTTCSVNVSSNWNLNNLNVYAHFNYKLQYRICILINDCFCIFIGNRHSPTVTCVCFRNTTSKHIIYVLKSFERFDKILMLHTKVRSQNGQSEK